jgi:tryptophanyl-tRNA synthetase
MEELKVTPWEVSGELNEASYSKLVKKFGVELITSKLLERIEKIAKGKLHPFLSKKIFFAHRDLNLILDDYENGKSFYLYTGRGPSGKMHIGHLLPFTFTKWLQDTFDVHLLIQITDDEKYLIKSTRTKKEIEHVAEENILDILSLGFDPKKTHIIKDYDNAKELYYYATDVAKHTTMSTIKAVFGVTDSDNIGKVFFPSMQIVPSFLLSAISGKNLRCLIPYAIDQDPYFRISRDVLPKLGYYKPSSIISKFLPALQGNSGKMSSSVEESAIFLDDSEQTVKKKLMKYAFSGGRDTLEEQRKYGANPDIDFSFNVYSFIENDERKVQSVYDDYKSGKLLSGEMKALAADSINLFLNQLRQNREKVKNHLSEYMFNPNDFVGHRM